MNVRKIGCALALVAVFAVSAQEPPAGNLTWQEANKRSAALVREKGATSEAADLAKVAFDLYPQQTKRYDPLNHAQLLLNLLDVRHQADGNKAALREVDAGAAAITQKTGSPNGVLVAVWQEAARIAGRGTARAGAYNDRALALAEQVLGRDRPDTIDLLLDVVFDWRKDRGDAWALARLAEARERAIMAGEDSRQMTQVDLQLAKLHLEQGKGALAIETYRSVIDRLEKRADPAQESYLQMAYAQLEYAYEENGEDELAAEMHQRRLDRLSRDATNPMPTLRIPPQYPATAARDGREGFVLLAIEISPDGTVAKAEVLDSSPPRIFDEVAQQAVLKWKFRPRVVDGQPVRSSGTQLVEFRLQGKSGRALTRKPRR